MFNSIKCYYDKWLPNGAISLVNSIFSGTKIIIKFPHFLIKIQNLLYKNFVFKNFSSGKCHNFYRKCKFQQFFRFDDLHRFTFLFKKKIISKFENLKFWRFSPTEVIKGPTRWVWRPTGARNVRGLKLHETPFGHEDYGLDQLPDQAETLVEELRHRRQGEPAFEGQEVQDQVWTRCLGFSLSMVFVLSIISL